MTEYVILRQDTDADPSPWYFLMGGIEASSPRQALRRIRIDKTNEGNFVAVPARSWKPLTVTVEQTTKITIS